MQNPVFVLSLIAWNLVQFSYVTNGYLPTEQADLEPEFAERITNITVAEGADVELPCVVENLGSYRVAWIRVESQTILTIHTHVITRNYRISLHKRDNQHWNLHIADVQEIDRGSYMCQINTVPMKNQVGYLDVVVPPKFVQTDRSSEVLAREGTNVTLSCRTRGHPAPNVSWQREDGQPFNAGQLSDRTAISTYEGEELTVEKVSRLHMGTYLCTADNGVPPSITRRISLYVHFPPMIWIPHQLIGASVGNMVNLECMVEAFPKSINYWTREDGHLVVSGDQYAISIQENTYKMHMKLTVLSVREADFGVYHCYAKNSIGATEGSIKLYEQVSPSLGGDWRYNAVIHRKIGNQRCHNAMSIYRSRGISKETVDRQRTTTQKTEFVGEDDSTPSLRSLQIRFRNRKTDERVEMLDDSLSRERNFPNGSPDRDKNSNSSSSLPVFSQLLGLLISTLIAVRRLASLYLT